jgi:hypothetical protein
VKQGKDIMRRLLRESRKLLEQREVQLKQPEQLGERNPRIARKNPGLRTVTARFSLPCEEQKTQNLPRKVLGKRGRIIKRQTNAKKGGRRGL